MKRPPLIGRSLARDLVPFGGKRVDRLVPRSRSRGPIPWVIAIMIALTVMAAAAGIALGNLIDRAESDLSGALTVQIIEANAEVRDAQAQRAAELLIADSAVTSVRVVPQEELAQLLDPWIGETAASQGGIPIPALVDAELAGVASTEETARLNAMLLEEIPTARVDAQSAWLRPVYDALSSLRYMALGLIVLLALGSAAAVWLAARSAFSTHKQTIEIVHLLGGTDRQIAQIFQRRVAFDALLGGAAGLALGSVAIWLVGGRFAAIDSGIVTEGNLRLTDWALLFAIPLGGIALAMLTARATVISALRRML